MQSYRNYSLPHFIKGFDKKNTMRCAADYEQSRLAILAGNLQYYSNTDSKMTFPPFTNTRKQENVNDVSGKTDIKQDVQAVRRETRKKKLSSCE